MQESTPLRLHDALLIVDPQNDFFPFGALPVPAGDEIIPVLNQWITRARSANLPILVSRDWHPLNHCSFTTQGGIWPSHCVQNTPGAAFHAALQVPDDVIIINKGCRSTAEAYSAFEGALTSGELLKDYLKRNAIQRLWMGGLALDYCVQATALDARALGFEVSLILSATRAITEKTGREALNQMEEKGIQLEK